MSEYGSVTVADPIVERKLIMIQIESVNQGTT